MFGLSQSRHTMPNGENVAPLHLTHAVWLAFGSSPGLHFEHVWCSLSTTFGFGHSSQVPDLE